MQRSSASDRGPGLSRQTDHLWRIAELSLVAVGFALWLARVDLVPGMMVALLAGSWGARFIWAANNVTQIEGGRKVSKMERLTARGAHLALTVALYLCLLEGSVLPVFFLFGTMTLIMFERVAFMAQALGRERGRGAQQEGTQDGA